MAEQELIERLERLERDNRRLKGFALATVILAAALGAVYAARPLPQKITAREFDVVDSSGRERATWGLGTLGFVALNMLDRQGRVRVDISASQDAGELYMLDSQGRQALDMAASQGAAFIVLADARGSKATIGADPSIGPGVTVGDAHHTWVEIGTLGLDGGASGIGRPLIALRDAQGFSMDMGSVGTVNGKTGETQRTSAASIIMFGNDKDHHVIWQAP